jgi:hypothetical protein
VLAALSPLVQCLRLCADPGDLEEARPSVAEAATRQSLTWPGDGDEVETHRNPTRHSEGALAARRRSLTGHVGCDVAEMHQSLARHSDNSEAEKRQGLIAWTSLVQAAQLGGDVTETGQSDRTFAGAGGTMFGITVKEADSLALK